MLLQDFGSLFGIGTKYLIYYISMRTDGPVLPIHVEKRRSRCYLFKYHCDLTRGTRVKAQWQ